MLAFLLLLMTYWALLLALAILGSCAGELLAKVYDSLCDRFSEEKILRVIVWLMTSFLLALLATIVTITIYHVRNA